MPERLAGMVVDVVYRKQETGYVVAELAREDQPDRARVVGVVPGLSVGDTVELEGKWELHGKYGAQFHIAACRFQDPTTLTGIERYLASGAIPGMRKGWAARLVGAFGADTLRVIDEEPKRLREIRGFGKARIRTLLEAWERGRAQRRALVFLEGLGFGHALAQRVQHRYGSDTVGLVRRDPYALVWDVVGIGFRTADRAARALGLAPDHPSRIEAGLEYALAMSAEEGHVFLPCPALRARAAELLEVEPGLVDAALARTAQRGSVVVEAERVYLAPLHEAETGAARCLGLLLDTPTGKPPIDAAAAIAWVEGQLLFRLGPDQRAALEQALGSKACVITGGPGTGKTTILVALHLIFGRKGLAVSLCAPTGRAARRMSEATGTKACTIHRLLEFNPRLGGPARNADDPLDLDGLIVDEASMVDVTLMRHLVAAVPPHARLVLVGDVDQLPSVGPGQVLRDVIDSGRVPVARLTRIYRQAEGSGIVDAANRILRGTQPKLARGSPTGDFHFVSAEQPGKCADLILKLVTERIPARFGLDPVRDVQVLCPIYKGEAGVDRLNLRLQAALNGEREGPLRVGDKVMQLRNDYSKEVYNGDLGIVTEVDREARRVRVDFDGVAVVYEAKDLGDLALAYACSIHKSQGSEYPAVVIALLSQHYVMLNRNLLYTALTRGKRLAVVVGSMPALAQAVRTATAAARQSLLAQRLRDARPSRSD